MNTEKMRRQLARSCPDRMEITLHLLDPDMDRQAREFIQMFSKRMMVKHRAPREIHVTQVDNLDHTIRMICVVGQRKSIQRDGFYPMDKIRTSMGFDPMHLDIRMDR